MKGIALVERIPRPFEILKSPYLSKLSGKFLKTSQNSVLYHLVHYFDFEKMVLIENIPQSAPQN